MGTINIAEAISTLITRQRRRGLEIQISKYSARAQILTSFANFFFFF